jgi:hypothetical protein
MDTGKILQQAFERQFMTQVEGIIQRIHGKKNLPNRFPLGQGHS